VREAADVGQELDPFPALSDHGYAWCSVVVVVDCSVVADGCCTTDLLIPEIAFQSHTLHHRVDHNVVVVVDTSDSDVVAHDSYYGVGYYEAVAGGCFEAVVGYEVVAGGCYDAVVGYEAVAVVGYDAVAVAVYESCW